MATGAGGSASFGWSVHPRARHSRRAPGCRSFHRFLRTRYRALSRAAGCRGDRFRSGMDAHRHLRRLASHPARTSLGSARTDMAGQTGRHLCQAAGNRGTSVHRHLAATSADRRQRGLGCVRHRHDAGSDRLPMASTPWIETLLGPTHAVPGGGGPRNCEQWGAQQCGS